MTDHTLYNVVSTRVKLSPTEMRYIMDHPRSENTSPSKYVITSVKVPNTEPIPKAIKEIVDSSIRYQNCIIHNLLTIDPATIPNKYRNFKIPKKKGGYREIFEIIDEEFKVMMYDILYFLNYNLKIVPTNQSFAYMNRRSALDNAKIHRNKKFILKLDIKDFFPSITEEIIAESLRYFTVWRAQKEQDNSYNLEEIIAKTITLNGHLKQGNPISPYMSNIVFAKFDMMIAEWLEKENLSYSRYCDDLTIGSTKPIDMEIVIKKVENLLDVCYNGNIKLNKQKTKQIKNTSRLYITGVKLNNKNELTYGSEKKQVFKKKVWETYKFLKDDNNSVGDKLNKYQVLFGNYAYIASIEPNYAKGLLDYLGKKYQKKGYIKIPNIKKEFTRLVYK